MFGNRLAAIVRGIERFACGNPRHGNLFFISAVTLLLVTNIINVSLSRKNYWTYLGVWHRDRVVYSIFSGPAGKSGKLSSRCAARDRKTD